MLLDFIKSFNNNPEVRDHSVSHSMFKAEYPIFVFDASKSEIDLKASAVDVRIEMEFQQETEAELTAFAVLISDNVFIVNPFNNVITREL